MVCSLPGSSVHGIFQARVLEWVAIARSQLIQHTHWLLKHDTGAGYNSLKAKSIQHGNSNGLAGYICFFTPVERGWGAGGSVCVCVCNPSPFRPVQQNRHLGGVQVQTLLTVLGLCADGLHSNNQALCSVLGRKQAKAAYFPGANSLVGQQNN